MVKRKVNTKEVLEELDNIHELVEIDNASLDEHSSDYCDPLLDIMRRHVEDKINHLKKYATYMQKLSQDDVGQASLNAIMGELDSIKEELGRSLQNALRFEGQNSLNPRVRMNHFLNISGNQLMDMINRLQRIQRVLHATLLDLKELHGN